MAQAKHQLSERGMKAIMSRIQETVRRHACALLSKFMADDVKLEMSARGISLMTLVTEKLNEKEIEGLFENSLDAEGFTRLLLVQLSAIFDLPLVDHFGDRIIWVPEIEEYILNGF